MQSYNADNGATHTAV